MRIARLLAGLAALLAGCSADEHPATGAGTGATADRAAPEDAPEDRLVHFSAPGGGGGQRESAVHAGDDPGPPLRMRMREEAAELRNRERAAADMLERIALAQTSAIQRGLADGEALFLGELLGVTTIRGTTTTFEDDFGIARLFGSVVRRRCAVLDGYLFQMHLPGTSGDWVTDVERGGPASSPTSGEPRWRCYAWPLERGETGLLAFFVDERGRVLATSNHRQGYGGYGTAPAADAASEAESRELVHATDAVRGRDGGWWRPWLRKGPRAATPGK